MKKYGLENRVLAVILAFLMMFGTTLEYSVPARASMAGEEPGDSTGEHTHQLTYISGGNGMHLVICEDDDYVDEEGNDIYESCSFVDGVCEKCGFEEGETPKNQEPGDLDSLNGLIAPLNNDDDETPIGDLYINGTKMNGSTISLEYGQAVSFTVKDASGNDITGIKDFEVLYYGSLDPDYGPIGKIETRISGINPGTYYLGYGYEQGDAYLGNTNEQANACLKITQSTIASTASVTIGDGTNGLADKAVSWTKPTKSASGVCDLLPGTIGSYTLELYKKEKESDAFSETPVHIESIAAADSDADVLTSAALASYINAYGFYKVKVIAVPSDENKTYYQASTPVERSNTYKIEDTEAPVISEFKQDTVDSQKLTVTVKDKDSGLNKYAFSTAASIDAVAEEEWQSATEEQYAASKTESGAVITWKPTTSGVYHFYAKDVDGPAAGAASSNAVSVSRLTLHDYYVSNALQKEEAAVVVIIGDTNYSLPTQSTTGTRKGYIFDNWYKDAEYKEVVGDSTTYTADGQDQHAYAKWEGAAITFKSVKANDVEVSADQTTKVEKTYGATITLTAEAEISTGDATILYNWKKDDGQYVWENAKESSELVLSNCDESGTYYCEASVIDSNGIVMKQGSTAGVEAVIAKKDLQVRYTGATTLTFGDEKPELTYSVTVEDLITSDIEEGKMKAGVVDGNLSTAYEKGSNVGSYPINFSTLTSANYNIIPTDATITVSAKTLTETDVTIALAIPEEGYKYDRTEKKPKVTITFGDIILVEGTDFTVVYSDNVKASTDTTKAKASITFQGNYNSEEAFVKEFSIGKAQRDPETKVNLTNWTYKNSHTSASLVSSTLEDIQDGKGIRYYYEGTLADGTTSYGPSTSEPVNAGTYTVYATIDETNDYEAFKTDVKVFEILPRELVFTSPSKSWEFDGNTHSAATYTMTGSLASGDGLQSVVVTGEVLLVTTDETKVPNHIEVVFDHATIKENYTVTTNEGYLEVTQATLPSPSNCRWDADTAGKATWTGIIKTNVEVQYDVKLYREGIEEPIASVENVAASEYDFNDVILAYLEEYPDQYKYDLGQYYFTVTAKAVGGTYQGYYNDSDPEKPGKSANITTIDLKINYGDGISQVKVNGDVVDDKTVLRVFQGQTLSVSATAKKGYSLADTTWTVTDGKGSHAGKFALADSSMNATTLTVGSFGAAPESGDYVVLAAIAKDDIPVITRFEGTNNTDGEDYLERAYINVSAYDSGKIVGYKLWEGDEEPTEWTTPSGTQLSDDGTTLTIIQAVASTGTYQFKLKDNSGNAEHEVTAEDTVTINKIQFASGTADATQTMKDIYVVNDTTVQLPANTFTNTGYGFKNWKGSAGDSYGNMDQLHVEKDDTLTAVWTDLTMTYKINYYEMGTDGNYRADEEGKLVPTSTKSYEAAYNTTIDLLNTADASIWYTKVGFAPDTVKTGSKDNNKETTVVMTDKNVEYVFNIFYSRNQYQLKYEFFNPSTQKYEVEDPATDIFTLYYGETLPVAEPAIPHVLGYTFGTSWVYETTGERPITMPAMNVDVTVSCQADEASYIINYYEQGLPDSMFGYASNTYSKVSSDTVKEYHGTPITYTTTEALEREGFTPVHVTVSYGQVGESEPDMSTLVTSVTGTVSKEDILDKDNNSKYLNINVYYTRNLYDITLTVGRKNLSHTYNGTNYGDLVQKYEWKNVPYGYAFTDPDKNALMTADVKMDGSGQLAGSPAYWTYLDSITGADEAEKGRIADLKAKEEALPETEGYVLGSFTDWSTGQEPVSMPAGDMTLARQYVLTTRSTFLVDVYLEDVVEIDGVTQTRFKDEPDYTLMYEGDTNGIAQLAASSDSIDGVNTVVDYSKFSDFIEGFAFYEYVEATNVAQHAKLSDTISDTSVEGAEPMHLSIYFDRKLAKTTINYRVIDENHTNPNNNIVATVEKTGKWGMSYNPEYFALFKNSDATSDGSPVTYKDETMKNKNFYDEKYVASVSTGSVWTDLDGPAMSTSDGWQGVYENYYTNAEVEKTYKLYFGKRNVYDATADTLNKNTVNVYYTAPAEPYSIRLAYSTDDLSALGKDSVADYDVSKVGKGGGKVLSLSYTGAADVTTYTENPETKEIVGSAPVSQASGSFNEIRVGNECTILQIKGTEEAGGKEEYYPGALAARGNAYTYHTDRRPADASYKKITFKAGTEYTFTIRVADVYDACEPKTSESETTYTYKVEVPAEKDASYYIKDDNIYMLNTNNNFFIGYRASYSVAGKGDKSSDILCHAIWAGAENLEQDYKKLCEAQETYAALDTAYSGVYEHEDGYGSLISTASEPTYNCYHYHHEATYKISYIGPGGQTYSERYPNAKTIYLGKVGGVSHGGNVETKFDPDSHSNYQLHWYTDKAYTTPIPQTLVVGKMDYEYYGRWEKRVLQGNYCEHFELSDTLKINGQDVRYLTLANYDAVKEFCGDKLTDNRTSNIKESITYVNEFGNSVTAEYRVITYRYKGEIVMIEHKKPMICFSDVSVTKRTPENLLANGFQGFYFDAAHSGNSYIGYCQTDAVNFDLYYAREKYSLSKDYQELKNNNVITTPTLFGHTVTLEKVDRIGYTFEGWKVYELEEGYTELSKDETGNVTNTEFTNTTTGDDRSLSFAMPSKNLYAQAQWRAANATYPIYYYFGGIDGSYPSDSVKDMKKATDEIVSGSATTVYEAVAASLTTDAGGSNAGYILKKNGNVIGAYRNATIGGESIRIFFAPDGDNYSIDGETATFYADAVNAIGAVRNVALLSEKEESINTYYVDFSGAFSDNAFTFSFAGYQLNEALTRKKLGDTFKVDVDMSLGYYYTRSNELPLHLIAVSTDGQQPGLTLSGEGTYAYGDRATIKETHVSTSYDFKGWYAASDLASAIGEDGQIIIDKLNELLNQETPVQPISTASVYQYKVRGSATLYAISVPKGILTGTTVAVTSVKGATDTEKVYQYAYGTSNTLKSTPTYPKGLDAQFIHVTNVKWYRSKQNADGTWSAFETVQDNSAAANYSMPADTAVGSYKYYCEYTLTRTDNDRSVNVDSDRITVNIISKQSTATATGYTGVYDAEYHNINVVTAPDATIYYNIGSPVERASDGTITTGTIADDFEGIKDVKLDSDGNVISQMVYYMVIDSDPNIEPYGGKDCYAEVKITPAPLKISLKPNSTFTKIYDGSVDITGEDKKRLQNVTSNDFFTVTGWVGADATATTAFLLDFNGTTNTRHVSSCSSATLTDLHIVLSDATVSNNPNYTFSSNGESASMIIPACINPLDVGLAWETDTLTYTSLPQAPAVSFTKEIPKVKDEGSDVTKPELNTAMLAITGQQTNVGTGYTAYASVMTREECAAAGVTPGSSDFEASDYLISVAAAKKTYQIDKCQITIKPVDRVTIYDGYSRVVEVGTKTSDHTSPISYEDNGIFVIEGFAFGTDGKDQKFYARAVCTGSHAGDHTLAVQTLEIYEYTGSDESKVQQNITENFDISMISGTYTILPREIIIEGIGAEDKVYDGNTNAVSDLSEVSFVDYVNEHTTTQYSGINDDTYHLGHDSFANLVKGLTLDSEKLTLAFETAAIGKEKTVKITYKPASDGDDHDVLKAKEGSSVKLDDFVVRYASCQSTTEAEIYGKETALKIENQEITYGDEAPVLDSTKYSFELLGEDTRDGWSELPTLTYQIRMIKDADGKDVAYDDTSWITYSKESKATPAGLYEIKASLPEGYYNSNNTGNYVLVLDSETVQRATLTINKRPLTITSGTGVTKVYDGTVKAYHAVDTAAEGKKPLVDETTKKINASCYSLTSVVPGDSVSLQMKEVAADGTSVFYNSKDCKDAATVTLKDYELDTESAKNYVLADGSTTFTISENESSENKCSITKRPLLVTAEDKTAVYGKPFPVQDTENVNEKFTVVYGKTVKTVDGEDQEVAESGFVAGESVSSINETGLTYACDYENVDTSENRHVKDGGYDITPSGLEDANEAANYSFVYQKGKLNVTKANITINASGDSQVAYGGEIPSSYTLAVDPSNLVYPSDVMDSLTGNNWESAENGWKNKVTYTYTNTETKVTYTQDEVKYAPRGTYEVTPVVSGLSSKDYTFTAGTKAQIKITSPFIEVVGLTAKDKVYDGTTVATNGIAWDSETLKFIIYHGTYDGTKTNLGDGEEKTLAEIKSLLGTSVENTHVLSVSAAFAAADAKENETVNLEVAAGDLLKDRYLLIYVNDSNNTVNNQTTYGDQGSAIKATGTATISQKPLTIAVKANKTSEKYGTLDPSAITYSYEFSGLVDVDATLDQENTWEIDNPYTNNGAVGTYTIKFKEVHPEWQVTNPERYSVKNKGIITTTFKNYLVTPVATTLAITKNTFATPTLSWDATTIGQINWTKPAAIGEVSVSGYELKLYKNDGEGEANPVDISGLSEYDSESQAIKIADGDTVSYAGFIDTIRANGAGDYYVSVKALSGNTDNVNHSEAAESETIHAAKITLRAKDNVSKAGMMTTTETPANTLKFVEGQKVGDSAIAVTNDENGSSIVLLAGESGIEYSFIIKNALTPKYTEPTGYTYKETTTRPAAVAKAEGLQAQLVDSSKDTYKGTFSLNGDVTDDTITTYVELTPTPATLRVEITRTAPEGTSPIVYGYSDGSVVYKANPSVVERDNISSDDYVYTYQWYLKEKLDVVKLDGATEQEYTLKQGLKVSKNYILYCQVTATRKDNNQIARNYKDTGTQDEKHGAKYPFEVVKAQIKGEVNWPGWTYGNARTVPKLTITIGGTPVIYVYNEIGNLVPKDSVEDLMKAAGVTAKLQFRASETDTWQTYHPVTNPITKAGDYQLQVVMDGGDNYDNYTTPSPTTLTVAKNQYQTLTDLASKEGSELSRQGVITWTLPAEIYENAMQDVAHKAAAWFHVDIHKISLKPADYSGATLPEAVFTQIKEKGLIVNIGAHQASDYADVPIAGAPNGINISEAYLRASDNTGKVTDNGNGTVTFEYDFSSYMNEPGLYYYNLFAYNGAEGTIENATTADVAADVYKTNNINPSEPAELPVNFWIPISNLIDVKDGAQETKTGTEDYEKVYDGKAVVLSVHPVENDKVEFKSWQWYRNGQAIDGATKSTYIVTYVDESAVYACKVGDDKFYYDTTTRKITINPRPIVIETDGGNFTYDGTAHGKSTTADWRVSTDTTDSTKNMGLATGDTITNWTLAQRVTTVADGEKANVMTDIVITKTLSDSTTKKVYSELAEDASLAKNYKVSQQNGILKIDQKSVDTNTEVTFSASDAGGFVYDGTEKKPEITVTYTPVGGETITLTAGVDYTIAYTNNIHAGTENTKPTVTITGKGNYTGTLSKEFTINKRPVTLQSESLPAAGAGVRYYNGSEYHSESTAELTDATAGQENKGLANGDKVTAVTYTGKQLLAGSSANTFEGVVIKTADDNTDVTADYEITHENGTLTVNAVKIQVKPDALWKYYDGSPLEPSTYGLVAVADDEFADVLVDGDTFAGAAMTGSIMDVGTTESQITEGTVVIKNAEGVDVTGGYDITLAAGSLEIKQVVAPITITANSNNKIYDGTALTDNGYIYTENVLISGDVLTAVVEGTITDWTDGGVENKVISYKVMRGETEVTGNYQISTAPGTLIINKRPVVLTSATDSKTYDGTALFNHNVTESTPEGSEVGGFITGQGATYTVTGSQTAAGGTEHNNEFTYVLNEGTSADNYQITTVFGTLTVAPLGTVVVTITEHSNTAAVYNGTKYTVNGYDVSISSQLYTESDFTFNEHDGNNTIKATYVGEYPMNLVPADFTNTNNNFNNVTFNIVDGTLKINPIATPITITADSNTKVYDGTALTDDGFTYTDNVLVTAGEVTDTIVATVAGTQTNAGTSANKVTSYKVMHGTVDVTNCYTFADETADGTLTITPKTLTTDDLTLTTTPGMDYPKVQYTGSLVGPGISVDVSLDSDETREKHLTESTDGGLTGDYVVTNSSEEKKVVKAVKPGTYTVEIKGTGNYQGTISKTYVIYDTGKPSVTGTWKNGTLPISNGGIYCLGTKVNISDPNLQHVTITAIPVGGDDADPEVVVDEDVADGQTSKHYTLPGNTTGLVYTIVASDVDGNVNDTMKFTVYDSHAFINYEVDHTLTPDGLGYKATCDHNCGEIDYIIRPEGKVSWDYSYSYSVPGSTEPEEGTQNVSERETSVVVELFRNGIKIAEKLVDCDDECGTSAGANASSTSTKHYTFTSYDANDASKGSGPDKVPYYDANGVPYIYEVKVSPVMLSGSSYTKINTYTVDYTEALILGGAADVSYHPNCFDVSWKVTLTGVPYEEGADKSKSYIYPSRIFVKVLYAEESDASDSEYKVISQQASAENLGTLCDVVAVEPGVYTYSGSYPCWEYIGGSTDSYYYRITVVGYEYEGIRYDVSGQNLRSVCDEDHVNHTIAFNPQAGKATGTIQYELAGVMPSLVFNLNYGDNQIYEVLWAGIDAFNNGGTITADKIAAVKAPTRAEYTFDGWFTEADGGSKIAGDVKLTTGRKMVYAHWTKIKKQDDPKKPDNPKKPTDKPSDEPSKPSGNTPTQPTKKPEEKPQNQPSENVPEKGTVKPGKPGKGQEKDSADEEIPNEEISEEIPLGAGSLIVIVENPKDDSKEEQEDLIGELPDKQAVAEIVLSPEELKVVEEGGSVIIRLTVDDNNKKEPAAEANPGLHRLLEKLNDEAEDGQKAVFRSFIDLRLEKKINDSDWEKISETGEKIKVVIDIPASYVLGAKRVCIAKADGSEYILLEDLDDDPNTITIMTDDFDSDYVFITLEDEDVALADQPDEDCFWHWFIALTAILYLIALLLTMKKKEEEEAEGADTGATESEQEKLEKLAKKSKRNRWISVVAYLIAIAIFTYLGSCNKEIPFDVVSSILVGIGEYGTYKHKFKELKDEEEKKEVIG